MNEVKKKKRSHRLTSGMIKVMLTCWIIPYIVLSAVLIGVYVQRNSRQVENTLHSSMESAGRIVMEKLGNAIEDSRQASYDGVIKKSYEEYLRNGDEGVMHKAVSDYLNRTYKFSRTISHTILLYTEDLKMEYFTYSNAAGATYAGIEEFRQNAATAVRLTAKDLDTKTRFICLSGHLYVVRNIVLSNFKPFATLVMELNLDRLFESMDNVIWKKDGIALMDGKTVCYRPDGEENESGNGDAAEKRSTGLREIFEHITAGSALPVDRGLVFTYDRKTHTGCVDMKVNGQRFALAVGLDKSTMLSDRAAFLSAYIVVFITLIPLLFATFWFFYSNINRPIETLVDGSEKIRGGEYGYQVEPFTKNRELGTLVDNFNHMSRSLEESFNRIYATEVAGRDAALKALQSQINPHFLNNTLEIINWKARMNGNEDVSEMISALNVMMNATLNRNNEMFITLEEELTYVDAYLYIIQERFGEKFRFTKQVDESLQDMTVPRLIIQPIVENAVEHGGDGTGYRSVHLKIFGDRNLLHIVVENNGNLSEEDEEKIAALLSDAPFETASRKTDSSSIGIRNVHLRLRMLYGKRSGLSIRDNGEGMTASELVICREQLQTN